MLMLRSVFIVWAAMAGCRPPVLRLPPGLVPQPSPDLPPGQVVGEVVDSASRSAIVYAKVVLLSDSADASPSSVAAAGYTDWVGRFSLQEHALSVDNGGPARAIDHLTDN